MTNKSHYTLILLTIIVLFPSICFSELKTVEGEHCEIYLGDMKNKKELEQLRKTVRKYSIENGLYKIKDTDHFDDVFTDKCISNVISNYLEKVMVVSHTEKGRKICDKVKITLDPEVIIKYLSQDICIFAKYLGPLPSEWYEDIDNVLTKKTDKMNIGLIIEIKIKDLEGNKREQLENEQESQFHEMIGRNKDKYKVVDRRHLSNVLEEQKLSSSGITDSETVKLGKILNLDIIVLRMIYEKSKVTKVLKVDTGEVLLFKTHKMETTETNKGWIIYAKAEIGDYYYDKSSITNVSPRIFKVWTKIKFSIVGKDKNVQSRKKYNKLIDGYEKLDNLMILYELDCVNNTKKPIKYVDYNDEGKVLEDFDDPNPTIEQIIPGSINELLLKKVCNE